ncbi:MAG TPA: acyl-CoA dehydratase activase [Longimicrobiales bacterium]|nr:acyl-CoA dehydratase activase [Longimicrobiales bacterium]
MDVGAVSISAVELGSDGEVLGAHYRLHHGDVEAALTGVLGQVDPRSLGFVASTTSAPAFLRADARFDNQVCLITAVRRFHPRARSILVVGGERFGLIRFDEAGEYLSFKANPPCAAGTGGFVDQQARRLNLDGSAVLADLALANRGTVPKIASRCAVFAKTDLAHAQQEGFGLEAICDGLCRGVAKNIADTLFTGEKVLGPLVLAGGVAKNKAVVRHLRDMVGLEISVASDLPLGAAGAALRGLDEIRGGRRATARSPEDVLGRAAGARGCEHEALELRLSSYPDFTSLESTLHHGRKVSHSHPLEVDVYRELESGRAHDVYLGVDVGSTSTKAVTTDRDGRVLAGFYTATAGRPLEAAQLILEGITTWADSRRVELRFAGMATTGAGRKFVGTILGADVVLDEITAHARAAVELHPGVDTILEIGGQDSKFTTLKDGRVTLSVMNNVCAAGTGSFIEEQAKRLDVSLAEYGERTEGHASPLASQRCTVFMERDLNHYMTEGYERGQVLAAVLHSVRENYLKNVALESAIGDVVVFQGATARNRALVAAFEQKLGKPIHVSQYCHLAGALGAALTLKDEGASVSRFRGLDVHRNRIPVRSETCELCTNHCKLSVAEVGGDTVAYGFLCGRDYETKRHVENNTTGFDLLKVRRRAFPPPLVREPRKAIRVGLPAALHLFEDLPFWRHFFHRLGIVTVTSERYADAFQDGRHLAGAEFCAPLTALHAHVRYLVDRADLVFLPFYLEVKPADQVGRRQFCYFTQFAPSLGSGLCSQEEQGRLLTPLVHSLYGGLFTKAELYRTLRAVVPGGVSFFDVSTAFEEAAAVQKEGTAKLRDFYARETQAREGFHVMLLGRPYSVLSPHMNKRIPQIFASLGVPVFYQDMLSFGPEDVACLQPILEEVHWQHAARILEAAEVAARTPGAYPVLVTSFKCSPDSFLLHYFEQLMESHGKPYLVLQLDEHDSRLGYETRIEAAVRAFQNHYGPQRAQAQASSTRNTPFRAAAPVSLADKTILFPNWDPLSLRLVVAAMRRKGLDARLLGDTPGSIRRSIRHNTGQCTPLNIIAQNFTEYVKEQDLDPARTVLWTAASTIACNIRLYPQHIRSILAGHGNGFEKSEVYSGALTLQDISAALPLEVYLAYMFGGFMRRIGCRLRPYERVKGATDSAIEAAMSILADAFLGLRPKESALAEALTALAAIECVHGEPRPEVAIFGDLYARDNDVLNQDLVRFIEAHGGEVITTPYTSYVKMVVRPYYWKWFLEGKYMSVLSTGALMAAVGPLEKKYFPYFERVLGEPRRSYDASSQDILAQYNVRVEHTGESMDNLLKIFYTVRHHPDVALFVQASPAFCCPSLITEAMSRSIEGNTGVPMVAVTYDGVGGGKNEVILPYLEYPRARGGRARKLETA